MEKIDRFKDHLPKDQRESKTSDAVQSTFEYKDGGYTVTYIIDQDGVIWLTFPERVIVATPDEIRSSETNAEIRAIFGGRLITKLKDDYEEVTGREF